MKLFTNFSRVAVMLTFAIVTLTMTLAARHTKPERFTVRLQRDVYKANLAFMRQNDFDVAGVNIKNNEIFLLVDQAGRAKLAPFIRSFADDVKPIAQFTPDSKYKTSAQVAQILNDYASKYPTIAKVISTGKSLENRDILAIEITQNVALEVGNKPAVLINGMHHAREVMSTEIPLDVVDYLLTNYNKDAKVTHWVNSNVIYVMPMLNVDGNNHVWNDDSMWRKNSRGDYGVDINRNYPYAWNTCSGSSGNESADDYRGPSAASEPETNVLMNFVANTHPVFDISFHSYSEIVIYPYGCGTHTETSQVVEPIGTQMAALATADDGTSHYTAGVAPDLLYMVDGDDIDWMYHEQKVMAYVIEVNNDSQGFQPSYDDWRDVTIQRLRPSWQYLFDRLDGSSIRGQIANYNAGAGAKSVVITGANNYKQTYPVHADGSFFIVTAPGDYKVSVVGSLVNQKVHVANSRVEIKL